MSSLSQPFYPRAGREFLDFCRRVVDILLETPMGVDQDTFLLKYYEGNLPSDPALLDFQWAEFKRARDYSNQRFDNREEGWVWMRARRGLLRGQFYYQAVAKIVDGEPEIVVKYPISERLYMEKHAEWMTRTRSEMRVMVSNIEAKKQAALQTNNRSLLLEAEREFDQVIVLAPRLAAINFDLGMTVSDLRELAKSPKVPRLLQKTVKETLASYEKSATSIKKLSQIVYTLGEIRRGKGKR